MSGMELEETTAKMREAEDICKTLPVGSDAWTACQKNMAAMRDTMNILMKQSQAASTSAEANKKRRRNSTSGDACASTSNASQLYSPSICASTLAQEPSKWEGMLTAMKARGEELLLNGDAANAALWSFPCLQFCNEMCSTTSPASDLMHLAITLKCILAQSYNEEDKMQDDIKAALEKSGAFRVMVKAKSFEQQADLSVEDQVLVEVKLAGGRGSAYKQNMVYYVLLIAKQSLLPVHAHCCAPILCIAIRSDVRFSCCARLGGHAISQDLCTWTTDQQPERLACMLRAAKAFCEAAGEVWRSARESAEQDAPECSPAPGSSSGRKNMQAPLSRQDVKRSEAPLREVLPNWLHCYDKAEQLGGLRCNVWLLQRPAAAEASTRSQSGSGALPAAAASTSGAPSLPNQLAVKFLEADGERLELALRSWAVHQAWGRAGCAPLVIDIPWLCAGNRYLGYAMEYLPTQQGEEGGGGTGSSPTWRLLHDWISSTVRLLKGAARAELRDAALRRLSEVALAALERAHEVQVDFAGCQYIALRPSTVHPRPVTPPAWTAVHGDLRPCNVAVRQEGEDVQVRFIDFGFAGVAPGLVDNEHAVKFPAALNTAPGMWVAGVEGDDIITKGTDERQLRESLTGLVR